MADGVKVYAKSALARAWCGHFDMMGAKKWMFSRWSEDFIREFVRFWLDMSCYWFGCWQESGTLRFEDYKYQPSQSFRGEEASFTLLAADPATPRSVVQMCELLRGQRPANPL